MPCDYIKWRVFLSGGEEVTSEFGKQVPCVFSVLIEVRDWSLEVSAVGQTIGADGSEFREDEMSLVKF